MPCSNLLLEVDNPGLKPLFVTPTRWCHCRIGCRHWWRMCWSLSDCLYCSFDSYSHEVGWFRNVCVTFAAHVEFHVHKLAMTRSWHVWNLSIACPSHFHNMSKSCPYVQACPSTCPRTCPEPVQDLPIQFVHVHLCVLLRASKLDGTGTFMEPPWYHRRTMSVPYDIPLWYHMSYHFRTICRTIFEPYIVPFSYHPIPRPYHFRTILYHGIPRPYRFRTILSPRRTIFVPFIYRIYIAALDVCWWHHDDRRFHAVVSRWYHVWKPSK